MSQKFDTADLLRLDVEKDPTGLSNLINNPNGSLGSWGWVTPVAGSVMTTGTTPEQHLVFTAPTPAAAAYFTSENLAMTAGWYLAASWNIVSVTGYYRARFEWVNAAGAVISSSTQTGYLNAVGSDQQVGPYLAPAGTVSARLRIDHYSTTAGAAPAAGAQIKFNQATAAKAATTAALATSRTNLVSNPSFETNTTGWSASGTYTTVTRSTAQFAQGVASGLITHTHSGTVTRSNYAANSSFTTNTNDWTVEYGGTLSRVTTGGSDGGAFGRVTATTNDNGVKIVPTSRVKILIAGSGTSVTVSLYVRGTAGRYATLRETRYAEPTGTAGESTSSATAVLLTGSWQRISHTRTLDDTAPWHDFAVTVNASPYTGGIAVGEFVDIDQVLVERASTVGAYFDSATPAAYAKTYSSSTLNNNGTTRTNLITNPSFEVNTTGWTGNSATITRVTSPAGQTGTACLRAVANIAAPTTFVGPRSGTTSIPVVPGSTYTLSFYARSGTAGREARVSVLYYSSASVYMSGSQGSAASITTTGWTRVSHTFTIPSGVAYLVCSPSGVAMVNGENFYFDSILLEKTDTLASYFDGSVADTTVGSTVTDRAWTGTAHASTSTEVARVANVISLETAAMVLALCGAKTTVPVTALLDYTFSVYARSGTRATEIEMLVAWKTSGGSTLYSNIYVLGNTTTTGWTRFNKTVAAPSSAASVEVTFRYATTAYGEQHWIDGVMVEQASTLKAYIDTTAFDVNLDYIPPVEYVNILGPSHEIRFSREPLDVGVLEATILDSTLDPSQSTLIRPGRQVRLMAVDEQAAVFTGKITEASVTYHLKDPGISTEKRARITLTAVDANADLAQQKREEGVAALTDLPYVLEGCGVPWSVNYSGNQVPTAAIAAINDNASALDQVAMTRDSNHGYAWVDRDGVLQVRSAANMWNPVTEPYTDEYTDLDVSYNTGSCINEVNITYLRHSSVTGVTEEVPYGPYRDEVSIAEWGVRSSTFTVQGISEATLSTFANEILAANSTPVVTVNSVTIPLTDPWMVNYYAARPDLYDRALVDLPDSEPGANQYPEMRVTRIEHVITPEKWLVKFGFSLPVNVASPTYVPSPSPGGGGLTIDQIARPAGEITAFAGSTPPAGWLLCDGTSKLVADYPRLHAVIGYTYGGAGASFNVPNLKGRAVIGVDAAQTEFNLLGKTGGNKNHFHTGPAHTHSTPNHTHSVPAHTHPLTNAGWAEIRVPPAAGSGLWFKTVTVPTRAMDTSVPSSTATTITSSSSVGVPLDGATASSAAGVTGSDGASTTGPATAGNTSTVDHLPPYISLHYIIRAI